MKGFSSCSDHIDFSAVFHLHVSEHSAEECISRRPAQQENHMHLNPPTRQQCLVEAPVNDFESLVMVYVHFTAHTGVLLPPCIQLVKTECLEGWKEPGRPTRLLDGG